MRLFVNVGIPYHQDTSFHKQRHHQMRPTLSLHYANKATFKVQPVLELMFHHARSFLTPEDILLLCRASPAVMSCYGSLCARSSTLTRASIQSIITPLNAHNPSTTICLHRSNQIEQLLMNPNTTSMCMNSLG